MLPETLQQLWSQLLMLGVLSLLAAWLLLQLRRARHEAAQRVKELRALEASLEDLRREHRELQASLVRSEEQRQQLVKEAEAGSRQLAAQREELEQAGDAVADANRMKSQFVANMSHELRTPLNGILGLAHSLMDSNLNAHQQHEVELIQLAGEDLMRVVNDILDLSKLEASRMELESIPFHLGEVMESVFSLLYPEAAKKRLSYALTYPPGMEQRYLGDPFRIRQVVLNLLGNAIKFTQAGFVHLDVEEDKRDGEVQWLKICIADSGVGIDAEKQRIVFEEFQQADASTTRRFGGTGLGLSLSRRIVDLMGGSIGLASEAGKGSRFCVSLPFRLQHANGESIPVAARNPAESAGFDGIRLVVQHRHLPEMLALEQLLESLPGPELEMVSQSSELLERLNDSSLPPVDGVITCASALAVWEEELMQQFAGQGVAPPELIVLQSQDSDMSFPVRALPGVIELRPPVLPSHWLRILGNLRPEPLGPLFEAAGIKASELVGNRPAGQVSNVELLLAHESPVELMRLEGVAKKLGMRAKSAASTKELVRLLEKHAANAAIVQSSLLSSESYLALWRSGSGVKGPLKVLITGEMDPASRLQLGAGPVNYALLPESPRLAQVKEALQAVAKAKRQSAP